MRQIRSRKPQAPALRPSSLKAKWFEPRRGPHRPNRVWSWERVSPLAHPPIKNWFPDLCWSPVRDNAAWDIANHNRARPDNAVFANCATGANDAAWTQVSSGTDRNLPSGMHPRADEDVVPDQVI